MGVTVSNPQDACLSTLHLPEFIQGPANQDVMTQINWGPIPTTTTTDASGATTVVNVPLEQFAIGLTRDAGSPCSAQLTSTITVPNRTTYNCQMSGDFSAPLVSCPVTLDELKAGSGDSFTTSLKIYSSTDSTATLAWDFISTYNDPDPNQCVEAIGPALSFLSARMYNPSDTTPVPINLAYSPKLCAVGQPIEVISGIIDNSDQARVFNTDPVTLDVDASLPWWVSRPLSRNILGTTRGTIPDGQYYAQIEASYTTSAQKYTSRAPTFSVAHSSSNPVGPSQMKRRRARMALEDSVTTGNLVCMAGYLACDVLGQVGVQECIAQDDLTSCGGCPYQAGVDCSEIAGALSMACVEGKCQVFECDEDFVLAANGKTCEAR